MIDWSKFKMYSCGAIVTLITICLASSMLSKSKPVYVECMLVTESDVLDAILLVETEGGVRDGRDGEVGPYQITKAYVDDVNEYLKFENVYSYDDRHDPIRSREIISLYWERYGDDLTLLQKAALHCAGADGGNQLDEEAVLIYLGKVLVRL